MRKLAIVLLVLIAAVAGGLAIYQQRIARNTAENASTEIADLRKRLWEAEKRAQSLSSQLAAQQSATPASVPGESSPTAGRRGALAQAMPQLVTSIIGNMTSALDDPETRRMMALQRRAQLDGSYAALFKSLGLPPEQLEKFKSLLVDRQSAGLDLVSAATAQGINPVSDPAAFRDLARQAEAQIDGEIRALLGDSAYGQYQTYEQTAPQRSIASQLEQRLSYTSNPLAPDQYQQLVQVLAASNPTPQANGPGTGDMTFVAETAAFSARSGGGGTITINSGPTIVTGVTPISNEAVAQAGTVLSAAQLAALQQIQQEQQAQQQVARTMRQSLPLNLGGRGARVGGQ